MRSLTLLLATLLLPCTLLAADASHPPALTKDDARRILEAMNWRDVIVVAVVQGVNDQQAAAPTQALVLALGKRDDKGCDIRLGVSYDSDLGWFTYDSSPKLFRVWTRDGCREIKAPNTW